MPEWTFLVSGKQYSGGLTMARIRVILEDDDGREINGNRERLYDLSVGAGAKRLVDIEAAVEGLKQAALPELTAELLTLAQQQFVAEVKKRVSCDVMGHGASPSRPYTGPFPSWCSGFNAPCVERRPIWS